MKNKKSKLSKAAIISISSLIGVGSLCIGAGCYFNIAVNNNVISNNSSSADGNTNVNDVKPEKPNQDNPFPNPSNPKPQDEVQKPSEDVNQQKPEQDNGSDSNNPVNPPSSQDNGSDSNNPVNPPSSQDNGSDSNKPVNPPSSQDNGSEPNKPVSPEPSPSIPIVPEPPLVAPEIPGPNKEFRVNITRTSGFKFNEIIQFDVFNTKTNEKLYSARDDYDDDDQDGVLKLSLPENGTYKIKLTEHNGVPSLKRTKYKYPDEVYFDKNTPEVDFLFEPIIQDYEEGRTFRENDVASELFVNEDVLGQPISLRQNSAEGKMTILMHFRTTCPRSKNTINSLNKAIFWPSYSEDFSEPNKDIIKNVEVICFTDDSRDNEQTLKSFAAGYPNFHFVQDPNSIILKSYFPNDSGYPKTVVLDYEGVIVRRFADGEISNQKTFEKYIPQYSKNGTL